MWLVVVLPQHTTTAHKEGVLHTSQAHRMCELSRTLPLPLPPPAHLDLLEPGVDVLALRLGEMVPVALLLGTGKHALNLTHWRTHTRQAKVRVTTEVKGQG